MLWGSGQRRTAFNGVQNNGRPHRQVVEGKAERSGSPKWTILELSRRARVKLAAHRVRACGYFVACLSLKVLAWSLCRPVPWDWRPKLHGKVRVKEWS